PGRYRSSRPVPVSGRWKSLVVLYRGDQTMAAPVYLPADPAIGASAIPAVRRRSAAFVDNTDLLLREAKPGPPLPARLAYVGWGGSALLWIALMAWAAAGAGGSTPRGSDRASRSWVPRLSRSRTA
ncbi:MAG: hypothetical protein M3296_00140, partial [Actinomycetota bacterium]|nr:hypothetical protein [Actinomycetota bacterium]